EASFNAPGTIVILITSFLVSLLLSTTFSFAWLAQFMKPRFQFVSTWSERWAEWKAERARAALEPEPKKEKTLKKQTIVTEKPKRIEDPVYEVIAPLSRTEPVVASSSARAAKTAVAASAKSKNRETNPNEFPATPLLRAPAAAIAVNEDELRERARLV